MKILLSIEAKVGDAPMPTKIGLEDRKALRRDLSNVGKPLVFGGSKAATNLKVKSAVRVRGTRKNAPRSNIPTDDEIKRNHELAKEGIEQCHFTGNDLQKLQKEQQEESIRKVVDKVMSALWEWTNMYELGMPVKDATVGFLEVEDYLQVDGDMLDGSFEDLSNY